MQDVNDVKYISPNNSRFIGITMGCPVGIGPEIILRFIAERQGHEHYLPLVIGDLRVLKRCADELQINVDIIPWKSGDPGVRGVIQVCEPDSSTGYRLEAGNVQWGKPNKDTGHAAVAYISEAVRLIEQGVLAAMVTCPIAKYAIHLAGYKFPGHTEMLASLCQTKNYGMMMAGESLKVSLVTIHTPLAKVPEQLDREEIIRIIKLTGMTLLRDLGIANPRIAVAGLNPHSGESGLFGHEEDQVIGPAVSASVSEQWEVNGPLPPDTVFKMALDGKFDAVVAMYHDQGLIPFKLVHFEDGVNITMGLPIIRTSVDHGTAYDIAGKGSASYSSLEAAFVMAAQIIGNRKKT